MAHKKTSTLRLINFITGISDGLILPLAACIIALPFSGQEESWRALVTGLSVSISGALIFGLARFLGEKEEIHHHHPQASAEESGREIALMQAIDIDPALTDTMRRQMEQEKELWLAEMRENDLGWETYDAARARKSGWQTAAGFLAGGLFISLFFIGTRALSQSFAIPALLSLAVFCGFGAFKGWLTGKKAGYTAMYHLATGIVVVLAAVLVVMLISFSRQPGLGFMFDLERLKP